MSANRVLFFPQIYADFNTTQIYADKYKITRYKNLRYLGRKSTKICGKKIWGEYHNPFAFLKMPFEMSNAFDPRR
jgi:hypothetical protein